MPKANLELPDGTTIVVEGSVEEIERIVAFYRNQAQAAKAKPKEKGKGDGAKKSVSAARSRPKDTVDHAEIINLVKTCDEAELIEKQILSRTSQVDRTLLPLYIVHEHLDNAFGLNSGDINKITTDLGIPISTANASHTLSRTASRYVIGDKVRKKGRPVAYKLHPRGAEYFKSVISGSANEN